MYAVTHSTHGTSSPLHFVAPPPPATPFRLPIRFRALSASVHHHTNGDPEKVVKSGIPFISTSPRIHEPTATRASPRSHIRAICASAKSSVTPPIVNSAQSHSHEFRRRKAAREAHTFFG